jgi:hypothetical protein
MTNLEQAARQALEALETISVDVKTTSNAYEAQRQAIAALRHALESHESAYQRGYLDGMAKPCIDCADRKLQAIKQPKQETVLQDIEQYRIQMAGICAASFGYWKEADGIHPDYDTPALRDVAKLYAKYDALYTATARPVNWQEIQCPCCGDLARAFPPAPVREWVGLTDEEIESLYFDNFSKKQLRWFAFARAIEAKLKEKNT